MDTDRETNTERQQMTNVVHLTERAPPRGALPKLIDKLRQEAQTTLGARLEDLFNNLDDALFELADRAASNSDQNLYFDAMRALRLEREPLAQRFAAEFKAGFGILQGAAVGTGGDEIDFDNVGLVDTEEMEIRVALAGVVSKANSLYALAVSQLTHRLATVFPAIEVTVQNNPFGPHAVCEAFGRASEPLDVDIRIRIILLKLFERFVIERLGDFYVGANRQLADAGVLRKASDFRRRAQRRHAAPSSPAKTPGTNGSVDPAAARASPLLAPATPQELAEFAALTELLHSAAGKAPSGANVVPVAAGGAGTLATGTLLERLHQAQLGAIGAHDEQEDAPRRLDIRSLLGSSTASLGQTDADVVNLVGMLFDYILSDRNLAIPIKALLARLQIPMLKVALVDRSFFTRARHPARQLLNELSSAGIGWSSAAELKRDAMYSKIESIVVRVLGEYESDLDLFAELLAELREFIAGERKRAAVIEQRTRDAEAGRARTRAAKREVEALLDRKRSGLALPTEIEQFVSDRWARVLTFVHLRDGADSERWFSAVKTLDDLLTSAMPAETDYDREQRRREVPLLLRALREGLGWIGSGRDEIASELKSLEGVLEALNDSSGVRPQPTLIVAREVPVEPSNEPHDGAAGPTASNEALQRIAALQPGQWVEIHDSDRATVRARLMTVIEEEWRYVFVNRRGMKIAERHRDDLAAALEAGELVIIDDAEVFDRALQAVIGELRRTT